jgi:hypothetical protein
VNVEINCQVPGLYEAIGRCIGEFVITGGFPGGMPISGTIRPFEQAEVLRHLSPTATRISDESELVELYEEGERFWLIDDHWGLTEINVLKAQFRSWVLPEPIANPLQITEQSVLWPVSQLMRPRGLCLIPAASIVRDGWGALLLSSFNIEPELSTLVRAGWHVVGQNWTAIQESGAGMKMLRMPGSVERMTPRSPEAGTGVTMRRVDLTGEFPGSGAESATCDSVIIIVPGRRPLSKITQVSPTNAVGAIKGAWPLAELHPHRRQGALAAKMSQRCGVFDVQLSRNPQDLLALLDTARKAPIKPPHVPVPVGAGRAA